MEPGDRQPAPAPLRLVQEFVNTRDVMERTDELATPEGLREWAASHGLLEAARALDPLDHHRAVDVREAVRGLLLENNGAGEASLALGPLEAAARAAAITLSFDERSRLPRLVARSDGIDGLFGAILLAIHEASCSGDWRRLKACREPTCQWAFYDHSRNSRSHWCTMSMCGSRAKARAYRTRKRAGRPPA